VSFRYKHADLRLRVLTLRHSEVVREHTRKGFVLFRLEHRDKCFAFDDLVCIGGALGDPPHLFFELVRKGHQYLASPRADFPLDHALVITVY
jgi:hypothetical protein